MMRITIEIDDNTLARVQRATGIKKKSPAVQKAVADYVRDLERRKFISKVCEGKTDYGMTNYQVEALGTYDTD